MKTFKITYKRKFLFLFLFLLLFTLLFTGCEKAEKTDMYPEEDQEDQAADNSVPPAKNVNDMRLPIQIAEGEFYGANGWLSNEIIVYTANTGTTSNLYAYNIFTGEQNLLFESAAPIASVQISPSGQYVLVRSSPDTFEALLTVLDANGKWVITESISAFDLAIEWNPYDENVLIVSSFSEDWNFTSYQFDISASKLEEIEVRDPFGKWAKNDQLLFLDWNSENPSLFAPLIMQSIHGDNETKILENIFQFETTKDSLMTITVPAEKSDQAVYTFMDDNFRELSSFSVPHLTRFSDWLVPYYDWPEKNRFLTFQPLYSGESDTYAGGFQLVSFDTETGEKDVLMKGMENTPLSCSPNGKLCLAGFYLEKLIVLDNKNVLPLVEKEEKKVTIKGEL